MSNARIHDQFYTKCTLAKELVDIVHSMVKTKLEAKNWQWLEPSAGSGAFLMAMPSNSIGLDLDPKIAGIYKTDFLTWTPPINNNWVVVGNPPFGKNSSLAIKFFNHAAQFADMIAFIVPRTFEKSSVQKRLNLNFHLEMEMVLPENSFEFEGEDYEVPCVFQVWVKKEAVRIIHKVELTHPDFEYVKNKESADFAFQRVGANAGKIKSTDTLKLAPPSHHFIRVTNRGRVDEVKKVFEAINWGEVKYKTAGNPSISKSEIVALYRKKVSK